MGEEEGRKVKNEMKNFFNLFSVHFFEVFLFEYLAFDGILAF